jgi:hypothetical protein
MQMIRERSEPLITQQQNGERIDLIPVRHEIFDGFAVDHGIKDAASIPL